jgi:CRP-like cAMP-binding protein
VCSLKTQDVQRLIESNSQVRIAMVRLLSERLRDADHRRKVFAAFDSLGRVAVCLVELCDRFGAEREGGVDIGLAITQDELAAWAGSSREAVAKAMGLLRSLGWVHTERRRVVVRDLAALRRYAP